MTRRTLLAVGASLLALLSLAGALAWGLYSSLTARQQEVIRDALAEQAVLLVGSALLFAVALVLVLGAFAGRYARSATRLASEAEVIARVDPDHRLTAPGPAEVRAAAEAVERLAERYREARHDVDEAVRRARAEVEEERNRLAALVAQLTQPVLVSNVEGRILLYNEAARTLLGSGPEAAYVGLGRSVFGIVDRDLVLHALELDERAGTRFATDIAGRLVRAHVSPLRDAGGALTGFLLALDDITDEAEVYDRRSAVLQGLIDATQRAVASIRVAVEAVQDFGEVDAAQRERLLSIVSDEAAALSERLERARGEVADLVAQRWRLELMRGHELLTLVRRRLEPATQPQVRLDERGDDVWVHADGYALTRAIEALARRLGAEHGVRELALTLRPSGSHAALDLAWPGRPIDADALRAWEQEPLVADGEPLPFTLREVIDRHGAECWCQRDPSTGDGVLRVLLPAAPTPDRPLRPVPARPLLDAGGRPEFYDFDLFRHREPRAEREAARLAALSYTVLDTETTGLDPQADELIAIGAVRIVNRRILARETFDQLIDPGRPVSPESVRIHGLTRAMLEGQPTIADVLPRFARFAEDTVLVGHNVAFDMRFLAEKEARTGVRLAQPVLDTLLLSAVVHPAEADHSLEAIAGRLGVSVIGRHTALGDALVTAEIFLGLLRLLEERGIETLGQALDAARRTLHARVSESLYAPR